MTSKNQEDKKTLEFAKNNNLENLISEINGLLGQLSSNNVNKTIDKTILPSVFIVGVPRSGTTLLSQVLASTNSFCFPTNFISRFYNAPHLGGMIQEMLFNPDFDYKGELSISANSNQFSSDVGKTTGPLEPHEFWYFWRRFFSFSDIPMDNDKFDSYADYGGFIDAINTFQNFYSKPFFIKALIINPYIKNLANHYRNAVFLYIKRDSIDNAISLYKTRKKYFDNENEWFSFKPREYEFLKGQKPIDQVIGQVVYLNSMIEEQLNGVKSNQKLTIEYDELCKNPNDVVLQVEKLLVGLNEDIYINKNDVSQFIKQNEGSIYPNKDQFKKALKKIK